MKNFQEKDLKMINHNYSVLGELPLVSVIVPTYNRPEMLQKAIESILKQTYSNFEIIVVNDCGVDVENIISKFNDSNISYIKHPRNKGLSAARNTGILAAQGKYVSYLDDDDIYYPNHLETLVNCLERSGHKVAYTDAHRRFLKNVDGRFIVTKKDIPYSFDFDKKRILLENFIPVTCFMQERKCVIDANLFDPELKRIEDWDLWVRLSRKWDFAHIKEVTCAFSWYEDKDYSMTSGREEAFQWASMNMYYKNREYVKDDPKAQAHQRYYFRHVLNNLKKVTCESIKNNENIFNTVFIDENISLTINKLRSLSKYYIRTRYEYVESIPDLFELIYLLHFRDKKTIKSIIYHILSSITKLIRYIYRSLDRSFQILISDGPIAFFNKVIGLIKRKIDSFMIK